MERELYEMLKRLVDAVGDDDEISARFIAGLPVTKYSIPASEIMLKGSYLADLRDARRLLEKFEKTLPT